MSHSSHRELRCFVVQALCFSLLLQGTGIAEALPLPPEQTFVSQTELEAALAGSPSPGSSERPVPGIIASSSTN